MKKSQRGQARLPTLERRDSGQALLIVVLVMVVALTVGLSVISKSITNLRTSTEEANSQKALAAAEAGIEQAIKNSAPVANPTFTSDTSYDTKIQEVLGTRFVLNAGNPVLQDNGIDVWLSDYSENPANIYNNSKTVSLTLEWGSSFNYCSEAALEVVVISGTKQSPTVTRYAYDPCSERASSNHFSSPDSSVKTSISGKDFYYQATISINSGLIARVIPLYANSSIAVNSNIPLPTQGSIITSVGQSQGTQRKVNVFQGYPQVPSEYFLYNLFSP